MIKSPKPTLDELYLEAKADLARGGLDVALKWAFLHAKAVARMNRAEQSYRLHDSDRFHLKCDLTVTGADMLETVSSALYADAIDLAEAKAAEAACEHVWRLAEKTSERPAQTVPAPSKARAA